MRMMHPGFLALHFFPTRRAGTLAGLAVVALLAAATLRAQVPATPDATPAQAQPQPDTTPRVTGSSQAGTDAQGQPTQSASLSVNTGRKKKSVPKAERVQQTKDTRVQNRREKKFNPLVGKDAELPDKQLYDKALAQIKVGHFDVGRLDLQTLLNTYPDSQYQMRAKLAVADAWYREGGSAALAQAEQEYNDFITFFPNAPEASEAQMRVGDIYFKQIDATDRDYSKIMKAEEAYRLMLKTYPDAPPVLLGQAKQDLREVQELLAEREAQLGAFYAGHQNWAASIARYQTVVDTYPQYSHMDDVLIGIGDAYGAQARTIRSQPECGATALRNVPCLPEAAKAKLLEGYESKAAAEYRKVVLEHAAAPHVEDAKERLIDMDQPVPTPTAAQVAASDALEGSRAQYTMSKRLELIFLRKPDTVIAARNGEPPLEDPAPTLAPSVLDSTRREYMAALNPAAAAPASAPAAASPASPDQPAQPDQPAPAAAGPLALGDVPGPGGSATAGDTSTMSNTTGSSGASGTSVGVEIVSPVSDRASDVPAATGKPDANFGLRSTGAPAPTLPAPEAAASAPDQVNAVQGANTAPPAPVAAAPTGKKSKKTPKPVYDKYDESSSKHKPKKGIDKANPF